MPGADRPETSLLDAAERSLVQDVAPGLSGEAKYRVLMAASAIRMSTRDLRHGAALARAWDKIADVTAGSQAHVELADVVSALRRGVYDYHAGLYHAFWYAAIVATSISNPGALTSVERDLAGVDETGNGT